jgi:pimeloyl-ACP methyl ester carboxylesterase
MASIRTDVLDLSFQVRGDEDGSPVLLVHGWPDAARGWRQVGAGLNDQGWRTIVPDLRGSGATRFLSPSTPRDGQAVALAQDALDLADALGLDRFAVVGHDWGARVAYTLAALVPERITAIAALALAYQPRAVFSMPGFEQARAFWYQWLLYVDAGVDAVRRDPIGFARIQWDTCSPPGWFDDDEFAATANGFTNPAPSRRVRKPI